MSYEQKETALSAETIESLTIPAQAETISTDLEQQSPIDIVHVKVPEPQTSKNLAVLIASTVALLLVGALVISQFFVPIEEPKPVSSLKSVSHEAIKPAPVKISQTLAAKCIQPVISRVLTLSAFYKTLSPATKLAMNVLSTLALLALVASLVYYSFFTPSALPPNPEPKEPEEIGQKSPWNSLMKNLEKYGLTALIFAVLVSLVGMIIFYVWARINYYVVILIVVFFLVMASMFTESDWKDTLVGSCGVLPMEFIGSIYNISKTFYANATSVNASSVNSTSQPIFNSTTN